MDWYFKHDSTGSVVGPMTRAAVITTSDTFPGLVFSEEVWGSDDDARLMVELDKVLVGDLRERTTKAFISLSAKTSFDSEVYCVESLEEAGRSKTTSRSRWVASTKDEHDHPPDLRPVPPFKTLRGAKNWVVLHLVEALDYACYRIVCPDGSYLIPWHGASLQWLHIEKS